MKLSPISLAMVPFLSVFSASAAVYQVVDLGEVVDARATYATSVNDQGVSVLNGRQLYSVDIDIDIDVSKIDFDNEIFESILTEEQLSELKNGELTATTHGVLYSFLLGWPEQYRNRNQALAAQIGNLVSRYEFQPVSTTAAFIEQGQGVSLLRFRASDTEIGSDELVLGQNNLNMQVGFTTPSFEYIEFTRTTDPESVEEGDDVPEPTEHSIWQPSGAQRLGVVRVDDQRLTLTPVYSDYGGGLSTAQAINDEGLIIGIGSVDINENFAAAVDENCQGFSAPIENCLHYFHSINSGYINRAMVWQVNDDLSLAEPQILGFLGDKGSNEPHPETELPTIQYSSLAYDVNNNGIIVGVSTYSDSSDIISTESFDRWTNQRITRQDMYSSNRASIFMDGAVQAIFPEDNREWLSSSANAINNNNIIAGFATKIISSQPRSKMFYFDMHNNEIVFPEDFFISANTVPNSINDQGMIVGRTEMVISSVKRQRAFKFNIQDNSFVDLNSYLDCDSAFTLVDATSINNSNEILATAVTEVPLRNSFGEVLTDDDGNPRTEFQARAVKLKPIANGTPSDCGAENEQEYSRKSAAGSLWSTLSLILLLLLRHSRGQKLKD
ncbi:DUF3466 family protein [Alkalimonas collagenimarina]|uniref:DUF3466 family protein n=1 Tax=Alkalimonas collagenimarina TaxID=400390 RepID=A0ABT9GW11_9GAMM|nr:DUF3466 family protein [Alkalimonas collagenimarina]MDP4535248.1 DUF3466 family protein [Alkalimonas collagenimarina]